MGATCCQCEKLAVADGPAGALCLEHEEQFQRVMALRQATTVAAIEDLTRMAELTVGLPPGTLRPLPAPVVNQTGTFHNVNVGGDNRGVINTGNARDIPVSLCSPEADAVLDKAMQRVRTIEAAEREEVLRLLGAMRNAKHADERLQFANVLDKLVKLAPVFKSVWTVAKTALGL